MLPEASMRPDRYRELKQFAIDGLLMQFQVGVALQEIRDNHGYRFDGYDTFEAFLSDVLDISRSRAYQMIDYGRVSTIVDKAGLPIPANEAQARELLPLLHRPEEMVGVWEAVSSNGGVTAEKVKLAVTDKRIELFPRPEPRVVEPKPVQAAIGDNPQCARCCPVHCR